MIRVHISCLYDRISKFMAFLYHEIVHFSIFRSLSGCWCFVLMACIVWGYQLPGATSNWSTAHTSSVPTGRDGLLATIDGLV